MASVFELFGKIAVDNSEANEAIDDTTNRAKKGSTETSSAFSRIGSAATKITKGMVVVGGAIGGAFVAAAEGSREYRVEQGKLTTAFKTAGHSADSAKSTYSDLNSILGDSGQAVEASNHLALLTDNQKELKTWTDICTGVFATFGDSLPIEGLTEAANETAKVGQVTGPLADALNWAGISEDDFNEKLAKCSGEQERQKLIMDTLNDTYKKAADTYKETNKDVIEAEKANQRFSDAMATIGGLVEPILTTLKNAFADLIDKVMPLAETAIPMVQTKIEELVGIFSDVTGKVWDFYQKNENLINTILKIATVAIPAIAVLSKVSGVIRGIGTAASLLSSPLGIVIGIIGLVVAAFANLYKSNDEFRNKVKLMVETIQSQLAPILEQLKTMFNELWTNTLQPILSQLGTVFSGAMAQILPVLVNVAQTIIPAILGAFSTLVPLLLQMIQQILPAISSLIGAIVPLLTNIITTILPPLASIISTLIGAFTQILSSIMPVLTEFLTMMIGVLQQIITMITPIVTMVVGQLLTALMGFINTILPPLMEVITNLVTTILPPLMEVIQSIMNALMPIVQSISDLIATILPPLMEIISTIAGIIASVLMPILNVVISVLGTIFGVIGKIISFIVGILVPVIQTIVSVVGTVFSAILSVINTVLNAIKSAFSAAWNAIKSVWSGVKGFFAGVWNGIKGVFGSVASFFKGIFSTAWKAIKTVWSGVTGFFKGIWDGIKGIFGAVGGFFKGVFDGAVSAVKNIMDGMIGIIKAPINFIIGGINSFIGMLNKIKIPDWVPGVGGLGLNLPKIPELAKGGVLEKGQVGYLEGDGAEAVVPLEQNTGWINKIAERLNASTGSDELSQKIIALLSEILDNLKQDKQIDNLQKALAGMGINWNKREIGRVVRSFG